MAESLETGIDIHKVVSRNPKVYSGELVFTGTRVPVDVLTDYLKGGSTLEDCLRGHPTVERSQAEAFLDLTPHAMDRLRTVKPRKPIDVGEVVSRNPNVHSGELVFAGTRVPVYILPGYLEGDHTLDEFLKSYPTVERWQVEAFLDLTYEAVDRLRAHSARAA